MENGRAHARSGHHPRRRRLESPLGFLVSALILSTAQNLGAQSVTVSRGTLERALQGNVGRSIPALTASGVDSVVVRGGSFTVDRSRFLAFRTGAVALDVPGRLEGEILPAPSVTANEDSASSAAPSAGSDDPATTPQPEGPTSRTVLPFRLMTADAQGEGLWVLRPVFQIGRPLRFDPEATLFRGSFYLAMEDSANRGVSRPFDVPVRLRVTADADTLAPSELEFRQTNFPLHEVQLAAAHVRDSVRIRIIPEFDLDGIEVWLPVAPSVVIETPPRRVQGFGLETATVSVSIRGARLDAPPTVRFESDRGTFEPQVATLDEAGTGLVRIRSSGVGQAMIRAFAPGFGEDSVVFQFTFPFPFLAASLLGGVAGGVGAAASKQRVTRPGLRRALVRGLIFGLIAAVVYYAIGISLLHIDVGIARFNEGAVFALAALAGLFGIRAPRTD